MSYTIFYTRIKKIILRIIISTLIKVALLLLYTLLRFPVYA